MDTRSLHTAASQGWNATSYPEALPRNQSLKRREAPGSPPGASLFTWKISRNAGRAYFATAALFVFVHVRFGGFVIRPFLIAFTETRTYRTSPFGINAFTR